MEKKSKDGRKECNWCDGTGDFYDFDSDLGYGIPVCGGCGGLGHVPATKDPDFIAKTKEIQALRHKYCPIGRSSLFPMHTIQLLQILEEMVVKITEHFKEYGNEADESLAGVISQSGLRSTIGQYKDTISTKISQLQETIANPHSHFLGRIAKIELVVWQGKTEFTEIEKMFQDLMEDYPALSEPPFAYANFLFAFTHFEDALPIMENAIQLEKDPNRMEIMLYAKARCLYILKKDKEAMQTAQEALEIISTDSDLKEEIEKLMKHIRR